MTKLMGSLITLLLVCANCAYAYNLSSYEVKDVVYNKVLEEAKDNLKNYSSDIKVKLSNVPFQNFETNEALKPIIEVKSQTQKFQPISIQKVIIKSQNGRILKSFAMSSRVLVYKDVLVSTKMIQYNEEINSLNSHLEKREISKHLGKTISNIPSNLIAKRNYPQGAIINQEFLGGKSVILKNSMINIVFLSDKGLQIKLQGKALKEGAIGDKILVRSDKYNKIYTATIKSPNEVTVRI